MAFVVDSDASLPEQPGANGLAGSETALASAPPSLPHPRVAGSGPVAVVPPTPRFSGAADFAAALGLPPLDHPETPEQGQDPLVPAPRSAPSGRHRDPDAAFEMVTGWRPDGTLPVPAESEPTARTSSDELLAGAGSRHTISPEDWLARPGTSHSVSPDDSLSRPRPRQGAELEDTQQGDDRPAPGLLDWPDSPAARRSIGSFGPSLTEPSWSSSPLDPPAFPLDPPSFAVRSPAEAQPPAGLQSTVRWTSFGDFNVGEEPVGLDGWRPTGHPHGTSAHATHEALRWSLKPEVTAEMGVLPLLGEPGAAPSVGRPTVHPGASTDSGNAPGAEAEDTPAGSTPLSVWALADASALVAEAPAAPAEIGESASAVQGERLTGAASQPAEHAARAGSAAQFVPAATFRPADLDLDAEFEPLADTTDVVDETEATVVVGSSQARREERRAAARPARVRRAGRRPGRRVIVLVALAVVAVIVGATALVGYRGSFWSSPDHDVTHGSAEPTLTPAPTPAPGDGAARAPKQSEAPKKPAANGDATADGVLSLANCTKRVSDSASLQQAIAAAQPGQKICATGNMSGSRLKVTKSGTSNAPVTVIGNGSTPVNGITIEASNVIVGGFTMTNPPAPGIELTGNNITVRNNTVKHPVGDDFDGLRFFGSNLKILNNVITDINKEDTDAHADCMQTFATNADHPASQNVLIDGNRCERIGSQCLMAEGPNSTAGDGSGVGRSANITFSNNFCQAGAVQAVKIDDVQGVRLIGNTITGTPNKAFAILNNATGAVVSANKIGSGIHYQVGMDSSSRSGYQGPPIGGDA